MRKASWLIYLIVAVTHAASVSAEPALIRIDPYAGGFIASDLSGDAGAVSGGPGLIKWTHTQGLYYPGGSDMTVEALNWDGTVMVGWGETRFGIRAYKHWAGGSQIVGDWEGDFDSFAYGVSHDGWIIVGQLGDKAVLWSRSNVEYLGVLPGGTGSSARDVSGDGAIVTGESESAEGLRAFRWSATEGMRSLGVLPGKIHSTGKTISAYGNAVAGSSFTEADLDPLAFRWTESEGMQSLGVLPGATTSFALGISGDGSSIVGQSGSKAFLWNYEIGLVDLNEYLPSVGIDLTGWELQSAVGLSMTGTSLVGNGTYEGKPSVFLVHGIIPEPATALLIATGGLMAIGGRHRRRR